MLPNKVLLIHNHYGRGGGAEAHFQNLVNALHGRGFDVYTFTLSANRGDLVPDRDYVYWKEGRPGAWKLWRYVIHPGIYLTLRRIVRRVQPGWVHLHVVEQPLSILPALRGHIVIQSVHTGGPVCLTSLLTRRDDLQPCEGGIGFKCLRHRCVGPAIMLPNWYLVAIGNWLLKRNVRAFLAPSEYLASHLRRQGFVNVRALPLFVVDGRCE